MSRYCPQIGGHCFFGTMKWVGDGEVVDFCIFRDIYELVSGKDWDTGSGMIIVRLEQEPIQASELM